MKNTRRIYTLLTLQMVVGVIGTSLLAEAGTRTGSGGDSVTLPNGKVIPADLYSGSSGTRVNPLDWDGFKDEIGKIGHILVRYGVPVSETSGIRLNNEMAFGEYAWNRELTPFLLENVIHPAVEYRLVSQLPVGLNCERATPDILPTGAMLQLVACTQGWVTYFLPEFFKLSIRDQVLLTLHERLHALAINPPHFIIADLVQGLRLALDLYDRQMEGERPKLVAQEIEILQVMRRRFFHLGFTSQLPFGEVLENGGGLSLEISSSRSLSPVSYVSVGSVVDGDTHLGAASELIDTDCVGMKTSEYGSNQPQATIKCYLWDRAKIVKSLIRNNAQTISNVELGSDAVIEGSFLEFYIPDQSSNWSMGKALALQAKAQISKSVIRYSGGVFVGSESVMNEVQINTSSYGHYVNEPGFKPVELWLEPKSMFSRAVVNFAGTSKWSHTPFKKRPRIQISSGSAIDFSEAVPFKWEICPMRNYGGFVDLERRFLAVRGIQRVSKNSDLSESCTPANQL